jgi:hypothetical protein
MKPYILITMDIKLCLHLSLLKAISKSDLYSANLISAAYSDIRTAWRVFLKNYILSMTPGNDRERLSIEYDIIDYLLRHNPMRTILKEKFVTFTNSPLSIDNIGKIYIQGFSPNEYSFMFGVNKEDQGLYTNNILIDISCAGCFGVVLHEDRDFPNVIAGNYIITGANNLLPVNNVIYNSDIDRDSFEYTFSIDYRDGSIQNNFIKEKPFNSLVIPNHKINIFRKFDNHEADPADFIGKFANMLEFASRKFLYMELKLGGGYVRRYPAQSIGDCTAYGGTYTSSVGKIYIEVEFDRYISKNEYEYEKEEHNFYIENCVCYNVILKFIQKISEMENRF